MLSLIYFSLLLQASASTIRGRRQAKANIFDPSTAHIVGGIEAPVGKYPSYVHVASGQLCGGTLIRPDVILTAAHCASAYKSIVFVGSTWISGEPDAEEIGIKEIFPHEEYESGTEHNDIMLVLLDANSTAPLTALNFNKKLPVGGEDVTVIGFGATNEDSEVSQTLMQVEVQVIATDDCKRLLPTLVDEQMHLCAGVLGGGQDSCSGDSGGPLYDSKSGVQYGVVSFGVGCAREYKPGVYTRVSTYREWISALVCEKSSDPGNFCESIGNPEHDNTDEQASEDKQSKPEIIEEGGIATFNSTGGKPDGVGEGKPEKKPEENEIEVENTGNGRPEALNSTLDNEGKPDGVGEGNPEKKPVDDEIDSTLGNGGKPDGVGQGKPENKPEDVEVEIAGDDGPGAFNATLDDEGKPDGVGQGKPEKKPEGDEAEVESTGDGGSGLLNSTLGNGGKPDGVGQGKPENKPEDVEVEIAGDDGPGAFNATLDDEGKPDGVGQGKPEKKPENDEKPGKGNTEKPVDTSQGKPEEPPGRGKQREKMREKRMERNKQKRQQRRQEMRKKTRMQRRRRRKRGTEKETEATRYLLSFFA